MDRVFPVKGSLHHGPSRPSTWLAVNMIAGIVADIACKIAGHGESTTITGLPFDNIPGVEALSKDCTFLRRRA